MKDDLLKFLIEALAISALLFVLWVWKGENLCYYIITPISYFLFKIFTPNVPVQTAHMYSFTGIVPFVSLGIVIKGFSLRRKIFRLLVGCALLIFWHSLLIFFYNLLHGNTDFPDILAFQERTSLFFLSYVLPFLLWAILFRENLKKLFYLEKRKRPRAAN